MLLLYALHLAREGHCGFRNFDARSFTPAPRHPHMITAAEGTPDTLGRVLASFAQRVSSTPSSTITNEGHPDSDTDSLTFEGPSDRQKILPSTIVTESCCWDYAAETDDETKCRWRRFLQAKSFQIGVREGVCREPVLVIKKRPTDFNFFLVWNRMKLKRSAFYFFDRLLFVHAVSHDDYHTWPISSWPRRPTLPPYLNGVCAFSSLQVCIRENCTLHSDL